LISCELPQGNGNPPERNWVDKSCHQIVCHSYYVESTAKASLYLSLSSQLLQSVEVVVHLLNCRLDRFKISYALVDEALLGPVKIRSSLSIIIFLHHLHSLT